MTIIEALLSYLNSVPDITQYTDQRVFVDYAPQEVEYPYIVLQLSTEQFFPVLTGDTDLADATIYMHIVSNNSRSETSALGEAVRINTFTYQQKDMDSLFIRSCNLQSRSQEVEYLDDGKEKPLFIEQQIYEIGYQQEIIANGGN